VYFIKAFLAVLRDSIVFTFHYCRNTFNQTAQPTEILLFKYIKSRMKLAGHIARMGEKKNTCRALSGNYEENKPLERPTCKWEDNIKMGERGLVSSGSSCGQVEGYCEPLGE
jgi:hypothetical protein